MKIQLELNGPEPIVVSASIPPITFATAGFHVDWEPLATLREVEPQRNYPTSTFQGFLPRTEVSVGEHWKIGPESALQLLKQLAEEPQLELRNREDIGQWAIPSRIQRQLCGDCVPHTYGVHVQGMGGLHPHNFLEP